MAALTTKLKALQKKSLEQGRWPLVAAITALLAEESSLDAQINVVGAMHEVHLLPNSLQPYWTAWRSAEVIDLWVTRCLERLAQTDSDYWALVGLLQLPMSALQKPLAAAGYTLLFIRYASTYKDGQWLIATFGKHSVGSRVVAPMLEIGWDADDHVNEATRYRAVVLKEDALDPGYAAQGSGSYFMRAKLPYGCWRIHDESFEIKTDWLVPKSDTLLRDYP